VARPCRTPSRSGHFAHPQSCLNVYPAGGRCTLESGHKGSRLLEGSPLIRGGLSGGRTSVAKKKSGYSKKSKDWLGRPIIEHHNSRGEKTGYSKPGKTFWGTPITERYNSKGEKTGYNKKNETFFGTPVTERYNAQGEKTGYSKPGRTFWGTPITEHYTETSPGPALGPIRIRPSPEIWIDLCNSTLKCLGPAGPSLGLSQNWRSPPSAEAAWAGSCSIMTAGCG
jgi:hypothetical protein